MIRAVARREHTVNSTQQNDTRAPDAWTVVVIGGGTGGSCLAQGLHRAGVAAEVYERDDHPGSHWEG
jgi:cation diffusion facilitator CzcD-associated flavoprotein CzcO